MNQDAVVAKLATSIRDAEQGIDYDVRQGASCPWCGERLRVLDTKPWCGKVRIRYQKCVNGACPLCVMDKSIKTLQQA